MSVRTDFARGVAAASCVIVAMSAVVVAVLGIQAQMAATAAPLQNVASAAVTQGTLRDVISGPVTLASGSTRKVDLPRLLNAGQAVLSKGAEPGRQYKVGSVLLEVSDRPVLVMEGATPAYRDLAVNDTGPDVQQLQESLNASGHAVSATGRFDWATVVAVYNLYRAAHVRPVSSSGAVLNDPSLSLVVPRGELAFVPSAPASINKSCGDVGAVVSSLSCVLSGGSASPRLEVAASRADRAKVGAAGTLRTDTGKSYAVHVSGILPAQDSTRAVLVLKVSGVVPPSTKSASAYVTVGQKSDAVIVPATSLRVDDNGQEWVTTLTARSTVLTRHVIVVRELCSGGYCAVKPKTAPQLHRGSRVLLAGTPVR